MTEVSDCLGAKQLMGSDRRDQFFCAVEIRYPDLTRGFAELH